MSRSKPKAATKRARTRYKKRSQAVHLRIAVGGWVYVLLSIFVGIAAVRTGMPLMFILFGTMIGGLAFSAVLARGMLIGVTVHRELSQRAWQHETLNFGYSLRNLRKTPCMALTVQEVKPRGIEDSCGFCVYLPGRSLFRAGSRLEATHRGRISLEAIRLSTRFPFGLITFRRKVAQGESLVVWPAKGRLNANLLRHGATLTTSAQPGRLQGGQDEFFGLRDYRAGDNPRWVHWRRTAGRETPVVREMSHPLPETLFLCLDVELQTHADPLAIPDRERLLSFAATMIEGALTRGYHVGLALQCGESVKIISPGTGVGKRIDLLDALADVTNHNTLPFDDVLAKVPPKCLIHSHTLLVSNYPERMSTNHVMSLTRQSRYLEVLGPATLRQIFEDHPSVMREGGDAS
ncbi:MAG: DUF58 domain-containing protein [Phycisphaerae bacterium]|nr:DUF58 domain-containing protein [Phycisphaerae bacterium]